MVTELIDFLGQWGAIGVVVLALLLAFGESAVLFDIVVPGEVGLVLVGAAAADVGAPVWLVAVVAAIGAAAGDSVGYWIGRRMGLGVLSRSRWWRRHLAERVDRAHDWFEARGGLAVAAARWVGALRAVVPIVAGTAAMPYGRFLAWAAPSALAWSAVVVTIGFVAGRDVADTVDRGGMAISIAVVVVLVAVVLSRWRTNVARTPGEASR